MKLQDYSENQIKAAIELKGSSKKELAAHIKTSRSYVGKLIKGNPDWPNPRKEQMIVDFLQPELDQIAQIGEE